MIFDAKPAKHLAMVPRLAVLADVSGNLVYTAGFISSEYPLIPPSPKPFKEWCGQLPPAEERLLHFITYKSCDKKDLIKYLQLDCITTLELMEKRGNMEAPSRGLFVHQNEKL